MKSKLFASIAATLLCFSVSSVQAADFPLTKQLYSLDYPARTYQQVAKQEDINQIMALLSGYKPVELKEDEIASGFLIVTESGKESVYLPKQAEKGTMTEKLIDWSNFCNAQYPRHIQWFSYMSTDNIESVSFSGLAGGRYSSDPTVYPAELSVEVETQNRESVETVSGFLKSMIVSPVNAIHGKNQMVGLGADPPVFVLTIRFQTGVTYRCLGDETKLLLSSSDIPGQLIYEDEGLAQQMGALRDLMAALPDTVTKNF